MSDRIIIKVPATWNGSKRLKDRSASISLHTTTEVSTEDMTSMDEVYSSVGWLIFIGNEVDIAQVPDDLMPETEAPGGERKPKILRLRGVKWHLWDKTPSLRERWPKFDDYWDNWFEQLMTAEKGKID